MSVARQASAGFVSILKRNALGRVLGLVALAILARRLTPEQFGLVAITEALMAIVGMAGTAGIPEFVLAYSGSQHDRMFRSAFWLNLAISIAVVGMFFFAAPFWADFNQSPEIQNLAFFTGFFFLVSQMQGIAKSLLSRDLNFAAQVRVQNPFLVATPAAKIGCAYIGLGVYSLVLPTLVLGAVQCYLLYRASGFKPGLRLFTDKWSEIFRFSKNLIGSMFLSRLASEGDKVILSKAVGMAEVGTYNLAYQLANIFPANVAGVTSTVLSAALPHYANDRRQLTSKYLSFSQVFAFFSVPLQLIMILGGEQIVRFLYGPQWSQAVLPFQLLALYSILRSITSHGGAVLNSLNVPQVGFRIVLVYTPLHLLAAWAGSQFGLLGLVTAVVLFKFTFAPFEQGLIMRAMGSSFREWLANYREILVINGLCATVVAAVLYFHLTDLLHPTAQLALVCALYCACFYPLCRFVFPAFTESIAAKLDALDAQYARYFRRAFGLTRELRASSVSR